MKIHCNNNTAHIHDTINSKILMQNTLKINIQIV